MGLSEEIYQEGLRIPPVVLGRGGKLDPHVLAMLLANVRTPRERQGDLTAQVAACRLGERRLGELLERYGEKKTAFYLDALQVYSARLMRAALARIPDSDYRAEDYLDDDGYSRRPVRVLRYSLRRGSGGAGRFRGGDGILREIQFLTGVRGSILSDRRRFRPYGLAGGKAGQAGKNRLLLPHGPKQMLTLPSKTSFDIPAGSILRIETPGGGGWGKKRN